jgi:hypothetical protein
MANTAPDAPVRKALEEMGFQRIPQDIAGAENIDELLKAKGKQQWL